MQLMLNIALRAARSAGELIIRSVERLDALAVSEKDARDYVSEVDRAAEQSIIAVLSKAYPTHGILAEESGLREGHPELKKHRMDFPAAPANARLFARPVAPHTLELAAVLEASALDADVVTTSLRLE